MLFFIQLARAAKWFMQLRFSSAVLPVDYWTLVLFPTDYHSYPVFVCSNYSTAALDPSLFTLRRTRAASAMHPMAKAVQPV